VYILDMPVGAGKAKRSVSAESSSHLLFSDSLSLLHHLSILIYFLVVVKSVGFFLFLSPPLSEKETKE
jgi:hypothetical protein